MRWELGQARPQRASLERIARAGGVTVAQLVDGAGSRWTSRDGYSEAVRLLRAVWQKPSRRAVVLRLLRSLVPQTASRRQSRCG
jgi:hypothetical protein